MSIIRRRPMRRVAARMPQVSRRWYSAPVHCSGTMPCRRTGALALYPYFRDGPNRPRQKVVGRPPELGSGSGHFPVPYGASPPPPKGALLHDRGALDVLSILVAGRIRHVKPSHHYERCAREDSCAGGIKRDRLERSRSKLLNCHLTLILVRRSAKLRPTPSDQRG